mgnify:CR=1 FL=1
MIANFALSLSFEGIKLLQRVSDGWHLVGETALDVDDLGAAMAQMRADALALAPDGMQTKILLPTEQIKFITLETAQTTLEDVDAALDGATPYSIDELVIDFDRNGGRTFIAAVARETLAEAEAFATEHQLSPVAFAAYPDPYTFKTEVFFGPTAAATAAGHAIVRDESVTEITGTAQLPHPVEDPVEPDQPVFKSRSSPAPVAAEEPPTSEELDDAIEISLEQPPMAMAPPVAAPLIDIEQAAPSAPVAKPAPAVNIEPDQAAPVAAALSALTAPPRATEMAEAGGFRSRRGKGKPAKAAKPTPVHKTAIHTRQAGPARGKPRFLGLILTVLLLIFMGAVALWASTIPLAEISRFFGFSDEAPVEIALVDPAPTVTEVLTTEPLADDIVPVALTQTDDLTSRALPQVTNVGRVLSPAEANRIYAVTGVWQRAPRITSQPRISTLSVAMPLAFEQPASNNAAVLPDFVHTEPDLTYLPPQNPTPFGTTLERDANGLVLATAQGIVTDRGVRVFAGTTGKRPLVRPAPAVAVAPDVIPQAAPEGVVVASGQPDVLPPQRPETLEVAQAPEATSTVQTPRANDPRPKTRPSGLVPASFVPVQTATATQKRPRLRPAGLAPATPEPQAVPDITSVVAAIADAAPEATFDNLSQQAVLTSSAPDMRPTNFAKVVALAKANEAARAANLANAQTQQASAPATVQPSGPLPGGVARAATIEDGINLRSINLIGVFGKSNARTALIRMSNGKIVKVQVGSQLDGGNVAAISENALNYTKRGRTITLEMPTG